MRDPTTVKRRGGSVPVFSLYGEAFGGARIVEEMLHVEALQSRSRLYHWEIDAHVHQGLHQVVWIGRGPAEVMLDETRRHCEGPAAVVVPPGVVHAFRFAPNTDGHVLTMSSRALVENDAPATGQALLALFEANRVLNLGDDMPSAQRLCTLFDALLTEFSAPDAQTGGPVPLWLARAVVWTLAQAARRQSRSHTPGMKPVPADYTRFVLLIERHFLEHWSVSHYANRLGISVERLNRMARVETGRSALDLIHARLVREACRRLVYVAAPVSKLAHELGFDDAAYFSRFFKRRTGMTPGTYRSRNMT